jgi:hypothetical protein
MALDSNGTGWDDNDPGTFYLSGFATSLDQNGTGYWAGIGNGSYEDDFYVGGQQTFGALDQNGNGTWNGLTYVNGQAQIPDGWNGSAYYLGGNSTTLDQNGNGFWNGTYYLFGVATTLDQNGNGFYNSLAYLLGSPANGGLNEIHYFNGFYDYFTGYDAGYWYDVYAGGSGYGAVYLNGNTAYGLDQNGTGYNYPFGYYINFTLAYGLDNTGSGYTEYNSDYVGFYKNGILKIAHITNGNPPASDWNGTGAWDGTYYVDYVATTLDQNGNGVWNGNNYFSGEIVVALSSLPSPSDVRAGVTYGNSQTGTLIQSNTPQPWSNYAYYAQGDVVSADGHLWLLTSTGGWTVGGAPGAGYGWQKLSTNSNGGNAGNTSSGINLGQLIGLPPFIQI